MNKSFHGVVVSGFEVVVSRPIVVVSEPVVVVPGLGVLGESAK